MPLSYLTFFFVVFNLQLCVDCVTLASRISILVIIVLYYPSHTIKSFAYGQATASIFLVIAYWTYFGFQFRQKAIVMKNRELHPNDPLLALPFNSLTDFLPRKLEGQVSYHVQNSK